MGKYKDEAWWRGPAHDFSVKLRRRALQNGDTGNDALPAKTRLTDLSFPRFEVPASPESSYFLLDDHGVDKRPGLDLPVDIGREIDSSNSEPTWGTERWMQNRFTRDLIRNQKILERDVGTLASRGDQRVIYVPMNGYDRLSIAPNDTTPKIALTASLFGCFGIAVSARNATGGGELTMSHLDPLTFVNPSAAKTLISNQVGAALNRTIDSSVVISVVCEGRPTDGGEFVPVPSPELDVLLSALSDVAPLAEVNVVPTSLMENQQDLTQGRLCIEAITGDSGTWNHYVGNQLVAAHSPEGAFQQVDFGIY